MTWNDSKNRVDHRKRLLNIITKDEGVIGELLAYCENQFLIQDLPNLSIPLKDEPHLKDWLAYQKEADKSSVFEVLKRNIVSFNFPIQEGISKSENYRNAVLKGYEVNKIETAKGLSLESPEGLQLTFKKGPAGTIPVIVVENPMDFNTLLQALIYKNEPIPIPTSMGAAFISGLNNWSRLKSAIQAKQQKYLHRPLKLVQRDIIKNKSLYQDRLIVVSRKPYSNIYPTGYSTKEWLSASLELRIQHEYAHYFTLRFFNSMRNNMHDELLADYLAIHEIEENFDAALFLHFVGLEKYPNYRLGGRMENYKGNPPLSGEAFQVLISIVYRAAKNLEIFDSRFKNKAKSSDIFNRLKILTQFSLEELALMEVDAFLK